MRTRIHLALTILTVVTGAHPARSETPVAVGTEFEVNTYTPADQLIPAVAMASDGSFVAVWTSNGSDNGDADLSSVQGQRYDPDGNPLGGQFLVNTYTSSFQRFPAVAADADGNFVVVWESCGSVGDDTECESIQGQRYASGGDPVGGQFQVNTYTTNIQERPRVAMGPEGDFVVVWSSYGSAGADNSAYSVQGQRYDSSGDAVAGEFQVNTYTTDVQYFPSVAMDADGDFVVVWESYGSAAADDSCHSIQGQRYAASGEVVGGELQINTYTANCQFAPAVAVSPDGEFVVTWYSWGSDGGDTSNSSIQGQRFAADGERLGSQFQVNSYTPGSQFGPAVAVSPQGDFLVVWESQESGDADMEGFSVQGQLFAAAGDPVGEQFLVNTYTSLDQRFADVAVSARGQLVAVWDSEGSSGDDSFGKSIQGQRFLVTGVFADGFESGDTSAWSSAVP